MHQIEKQPKVAERWTTKSEMFRFYTRESVDHLILPLEVTEELVRSS